MFSGSPGAAGSKIQLWMGFPAPWLATFLVLVRGLCVSLMGSPVLVLGCGWVRRLWMARNCGLRFVSTNVFVTAAETKSGIREELREAKVSDKVVPSPAGE